MRGAVIEKGKLVLGYAGAGIIFALLSTVTTSLLSDALGLNFSNDVQGISSTFFNPQDLMSIAFLGLTLIILGVYVWIFGYIGAWIKSKITKGGNVKLQKRPHLVALLLMGVVLVAVFSIFDSILAGIDSSGSLTDTGALVDAITSFNVISIVYRVLAFSALGFIVLWLGGHFATIDKKVPDQFKKI